MSETIPTYRTKNGKLLTGSEAREAWSGQSARCNCGAYGSAEHTISGSCFDMPAMWLRCRYHPNAVGEPLIYRLPSQM